MAKEAMYIEIYNTIKEWIHTQKYNEGDLLPTELELGQQFFTSRITIQKAMQMLAKEGYVKRIAGRGTYVNFSNKIDYQPKYLGLILCNVGASFGVDLLTSAEKEATKLGYSIIFKNTHDSIKRENDAISELISLNCAGIIIQPVHGEFYSEKIIQLHLSKYPVVLIDRVFSGFPIPSVSTDNILAAEDAVNYLFENGHSNIGFACYHTQNTSSTNDRINGFKSAFIKNHRFIDEHQLLLDIKSPSMDSIGKPDIWEEDKNNIKNFIKNNNFTAILASEFTVAKLLFESLDELGLHAPEDISIMMFDEAFSANGPIITHVRQGQEEMGTIAISLLSKKINNEVITEKVYIPHFVDKGMTVKKIN